MLTSRNNLTISLSVATRTKAEMAANYELIVAVLARRRCHRSSLPYLPKIPLQGLHGSCQRIRRSIEEIKLWFDDLKMWLVTRAFIRTWIKRLIISMSTAKTALTWDAMKWMEIRSFSWFKENIAIKEANDQLNIIKNMQISSASSRAWIFCLW